MIFLTILKEVITMLNSIFWLLVGAFVGWNFPQPEWAQRVQERIKSFFSKK